MKIKSEIEKKLGVFLLAVILSISFVSANYDENEFVCEDIPNVITDAADRIIDLQYTDGSWDWAVTNQVGPTGTTYLNIAGVTAEVLLDAYELTLDAKYLDAAKDAGDYLITEIGNPVSDSQRQNAFSIVFLYHLYDASGDVQYKNQADAILNHILYEENYWTNNNGDNCGTDGCEADELLDALKNYRSWSTDPTGIVVWDLYKFIEAAQIGGEASFANDMANELNTYLSQPGFDNTIEYYELGLSAGILGLGKAGLDYSSYLSDLLSKQNPDGSFGITEPIQTTAYALMALKYAGETEAVEDVASYLMANFGYSSYDGWLDNGVEYSEVTSEAGQALSEGYVQCSEPAEEIPVGQEVPISPGTISPGDEGPDVHLMDRYLDIGIDIDGSGSSINPSDIRNGFYAFMGERIYYLVLIRDQNGAADINTVKWIRNSEDETSMCAPMAVIQKQEGNAFVNFNNEDIYINQATNLAYDDQIDMVYRCQVEVEGNWGLNDKIAVKATDQTGNYGQTLEETWTFNPALIIEVTTSDGNDLSFGDIEKNQAVPGATSPNCEMGISETLANRNCLNYQNLPVGQKLCDVSFSTNKIIIENKGIVDLWPFIAATDFHDNGGMATCPFDNTLSANQFEYRAIQGSWDSGWKVMPEYSPNLGCNGPIGGDSCRGACRITEGCPINILGPSQNIQMQLKIVWPTPCIGSFNEGSIYAI
ncbi:MAG: hypothetical protein ABIG69_17870, partial [Bacteroidota bacterium]